MESCAPNFLTRVPPDRKRVFRVALGIGFSATFPTAISLSSLFCLSFSALVLPCDGGRAGKWERPWRQTWGRRRRRRRSRRRYPERCAHALATSRSEPSETSSLPFSSPPILIYRAVRSWVSLFFAFFFAPFEYPRIGDITRIHGLLYYRGSFVGIFLVLFSGCENKDVFLVLEGLILC